MGLQIKASRIDTNVGLELTVSPTSLIVTSAVVAIRDANIIPTFPPTYLDFFDDTFKTAGFTTRQVALVALGDNKFALNGGLDISIITNLLASTVLLVAEFEATVGGIVIADSDNIELAQDDTQVHVGFARLNAANLEITVFGKRRGVDIPLTSASLDFFDSDGTLRFTVFGPLPAVDAQGHILFTVADTLVVQASYCIVTITDSQGSYTTHRAVPFTF